MRQRSTRDSWSTRPSLTRFPKLCAGTGLSRSIPRSLGRPASSPRSRPHAWHCSRLSIWDASPKVNFRFTLSLRDQTAHFRRCRRESLRNREARTLLRKIGRLFTIRTRFEAWLVIYAIALGAVERGRLYLETYPGFGGWLLALACTGVVFVAGAKLLDSVKPSAPAVAVGPHSAIPRRRSPIGRSRPRLPRFHPASESRSSHRRD